MRYVVKSVPVERFLTSMANTRHMGQQQAMTLQEFLQYVGLNIKYCRGPHNTSNMSRLYHGMQRSLHITFAKSRVTSCVRHAVAFSDFVYVSRCGFLMRKLTLNDLPVPKRWYFHAHAMQALLLEYHQISDCIVELANDQMLKSRYRCTS